MSKSVYTGWDASVPVNLHDVTVTKPGWSLRKGPRATPPHDFARMRRLQPNTKLLPQTVDWLLGLPPKVRPHSLAKKFARIANNLCYLWSDAIACRRYFNDLLTDHRGGRQGFPAPIAQELLTLRRYFDARSSSHPGRELRRT
jgi:hypothetical protein